MTIKLHDSYSVSYFAGVLARNLRSGYITLNIRATMQVASKEWEPDITWVENCAFNKDEGNKTSSECTEPGGTKEVWQDGKAYSVHQACWAYRDTYITQPADFGACQSLMDNKACTLSFRQCAFSSEEGTCLHEYATYSCETRTSGKQMICGGDVFCLDGECDKAASGKNNDFGQAVSELAALAAAGKDVAEMDGVNVRAFTGNAKYCKKFAAGFSNCCKDSGWGQDVGLARCSSEEKALAKAKTNKLTISIGEFCSKKSWVSVWRKSAATVSSIQNSRRLFSSRDVTASCISDLAARKARTVGVSAWTNFSVSTLTSWISQTSWRI